jgi:hypothetical protein
MVGIGRSDHQKIGICKRRDKDTGIAGRND